MVKKLNHMSHKKRIFFSILIAFAVISFWRGIWGLSDVYLFPGNYELSLWMSMLSGLLILIVTKYATKELI